MSRKRYRIDVRDLHGGLSLRDLLRYDVVEAHFTEVFQQNETPGHRVDPEPRAGAEHPAAAFAADRALLGPERGLGVRLLQAPPEGVHGDGRARLQRQPAQPAGGRPASYRQRRSSDAAEHKRRARGTRECREHGRADPSGTDAKGHRQQLERLRRGRHQHCRRRGHVDLSIDCGGHRQHLQRAIRQRTAERQQAVLQLHAQAGRTSSSRRSPRSSG